MLVRVPVSEGPLEGRGPLGVGPATQPPVPSSSISPHPRPPGSLIPPRHTRARTNALELTPSLSLYLASEGKVGRRLKIWGRKV